MRGDGRSRVQDGIQLAAHVANTGDAVGQQQRQNEVGTRGGRPIEVDVGMHVPESWDEVLALGVDDPASPGADAGGRAHPDDARAGDNHCPIGLNRAGGDIDYVGVNDGQLLRLRGPGAQKDGEE